MCNNILSYFHATQMADPLTALMYAVQVMNFLKTLIVKTLKEREDSMVESSPVSHTEPSDEDGIKAPHSHVLRRPRKRTRVMKRNSLLPENLL